MFNVQEALSLEPLTRAKVVGGTSGLHRVIENVTVMEVPDLLQWLKGNDFVITSLFCIKDDPRAQVRLVQDMAHRDCAALAIKSGRYVKTLPTGMIEAANSFSLPLLDIPEDITYIDIINPLMERLLDHTAGVLRQADMAFHWLQEVILNDQGLEAALATLRRLLKYDLTLECPGAGLMLTTPKDKCLFNPLSHETIRRLNNNTCQPFFLMRIRGKEEIPCLVIPITARTSTHALLTIEQYDKEQGLSPTSQAILDHTLPLIGIETMRLYNRALQEHQQVNSFVEELITQDFKSDKAMMERGRYLGLDLSHPTLSIMFDIEKIKNITEEKMQLLKEQLRQDLGSQLKDKNIPFIIALRNNSLVIITTWPPEQSKEQIASNAYKMVQNIFLHLHWAFPTLHLTCGIGRPQQGINNIGIGFTQALKAITLGRQAHGQGKVYSYDKLGVFRLLCSHPDTEELISLRDEILGPLANYDKKQNANLIGTLTSYFYHNEDINDTAKALFIHPNTVRYRLERATSLLSRDLSSTEHRFQLYLALKIAGLYPFADTGKNKNG